MNSLKTIKDTTRTKKKITNVVRRFDAAQIELTHVLTDGLFKPMHVGSKRPVMHITNYFKYGDDQQTVCIEWRGEQLDIGDQSVLIAILRILSEKNRRSEVPYDVRNGLYTVIKNMNINPKIDFKVVGAQMTLYELCKTIGIADSGQNIKSVYDSVKRLVCTRCFIYQLDAADINIDRRTEKSFSLISDYSMENGKIFIGVSPLLTMALIGKQSIVIIDMPSQRILKSEVAKRLHVWLSAWASWENERGIKLETLVEHVWGDAGDTSNVKRNRRVKIREALGKISELEGWSVRVPNPKDDGMVYIKKPKYKEISNA